jgi:putative ABC transport system permease protein
VIAAAAALTVFVAVHVALAIVAVRRRFLSRLAVREVSRRRWQSVLVVVGLAVGAAGITAALVAGDAVRETALLNAYRTWAGTDVTVTAPGGSPFPAEVLDRLRRDAGVAAATDGLQGGVEVVAPVAAPAQRAVDDGVRIIGFEPDGQAPFGAYVGGDGAAIDPTGLGPGEVLVTERLADSLGATTGDSILMGLHTGPHEVTIGGVIRAEGAGAYGLRPAVHAPLAALAPLTDGGRYLNVVRVSAVGGVRSGVDASPAAAAAVEEALVGSHDGFEVREVKAAELEGATAGTAWFRAMLGGLSTLLVAAGLTLVVNLALMLAEERRSRLGILRAIGLRQGDLIRLAVLEGAMYSLAATVVGTLVGAGTGAVLARQFVVALTQVSGDVVDLSLTVPMSGSTLLLAFCAGALLTLTTVWLASRRTARMTITAAIRDLPDPPRAGRSRQGTVAIGVAGAVSLVAALAPIDPIGRLLAGALVVSCVAVLARGRMSERLRSSLTGVALTVWSLHVVFTNPDMSDPEAFMALFTLGTLVSVFGLAILAAGNLRSVETAVGLLGGRSGRLRATLRIPLAELARRPVRTGLTTGAFGLILAVLTLFAMLFATVEADVERDAVGFDVIATSAAGEPIELPAELAGQVVREARIPTSTFVGRVASTFYNGESVMFPLYEVTPELVASPPSGLQSRADGYAGDAEVWATAAEHPSAVIGLLGFAGDPATLAGRDGPLEVHLAGVPLGPFFGIFAGSEAFTQLRTDEVRETLLLDLASGVDAASFARELESALFTTGVDATTTAEVLELLTIANRNFFASSELLMRLGLVVGILTLGILALRAVVERRRAIGVARAIGLRRRQILAGMLTEALVAVTIGAVVGLIAGVSLARNLLTQVYPSLPLGVDTGFLVGVLVLAYGAVLVVTVVPAWRASRLRPVEAIRTAP